MIYQCLIHTSDSNKGVTREFDLDILPSEINKLNKFAFAYKDLTSSYAIITKITCVVYTADKPLFNSENYPSVKIMYSTIVGSIKNITLPYVKKTKDKKDIMVFMQTWINDYKGFVSDPLYKKII